MSKTREQLAEQIKNLDEQIKILQVERNAVRAKLAAIAKWRKGDIVKTPDGIFKLTSIPLKDDGSVDDWGFKGHKQKVNGDWYVDAQFMYKARLMELVERPE